MTTVTLVVDRTATWGKLVLASIPLGAFFSYASQAIHHHALGTSRDPTADTLDFSAAQQPEILRAWGLGRLIGDSTVARRDAGPASDDTNLDNFSRRRDSSQPYWGIRLFTDQQQVVVS
jgi:hypothetical protein